MTRENPLAPKRRSLNPVLLDAPLADAEAGRASVFYTPTAQALDRHMPLVAAGTAGLCLLAAFVCRQAGAPSSGVHLLTLLAFTIAGVPALTSVWDTVRELRIDIDVLMLLGAGLAAWIGSPMEGALLLVLFALSGAMETYALRRTQSAIVGLRKLSPSEAVLLTGSGQQTVRLKEIARGQRVLVRPGDRVPLDGTVVEGSSAVDESAITGESVPREKARDDPVFAGTVNTHGRLVVEVTKTAGDTTLARIVELVTEARQRKARVERLIDRIGPPYSIAVIALSVTAALTLPFILGLSWTESIRRGIAVLIVGSPCALIIATPVAYLSGIAGAARRGVLIKGGRYLEALAGTAVMVFDKTGTLTTGQVRLTDVIPLAGTDRDEALRLAGAVEASSTHPLARAVMAAVEERQLAPHQAQDFHSIPGEGLSARVNSQQVWIGRPALALDRLAGDARDHCSDTVEQVRSRGQTAAVMLVDDSAIVLAFQDTLRDKAAACVESLRNQGIGRVEMLTGDHLLVASAIARQVGLDGYHAELLPEDKLTISRSLREQYGQVVMVGDGVNDAPALVDADVGIAIGSIGADVALDAADVVLMSDRVEQIAWLHRQARRTAAIVRQNLTLAVGVITVLGGFALLTGVPLPLAVIGHEGSTVLVALNALRLLRKSD